MKKPVLLFAFANERPGEKGRLDNLPKEMNAIKRSLEKVEDHDLCNIQLLPNANLEQLIHTFQRKKFRDKVAIFHYGGHATDLELMLEADQTGLAGAKSDGLIPFLANQKGLKLVFLNGCFSTNQAQNLVRAGIPAVIGTISAIDDQIAAVLSTGFYSAMAEGATIDQAWKEATFKVQAQVGTDNLNAYYQTAVSTDTRGIGWAQASSRFPWEIHYRQGHEYIQNWNLPDAAGDPYFGLPDIPGSYGYPDQPFRFLNRYKKKSARIFFGRGQYIRDLYHRLTSPHAAPILLLYGQSGVGKSSLLEAGLFPRLESQYDLVYLRMATHQSIFAQLTQAFNTIRNDEGQQANRSDQVDPLQDAIGQLREVQKQVTGLALKHLEQLIDSLSPREKKVAGSPLEDAPYLLKSWLRAESGSSKDGVIIVLDQVEEVFTQFPPEQVDEFNQLLQSLQFIFNESQRQPIGKIVFSYRKEYDSEVDKAFSTLGLPKEKVFLDKLDKRGVEEVVKGIASSPQLFNKYSTKIEEGLAELIAANLLLDQNSPISPVLQIVLTKLWRLQEAEDHRLFTLDDYQKLKREGILLDDFFREQMAKIRAWEKEIAHRVESSGLALDVLYYHTSKFVTAESHSLEDLRQKYQHQSAILDDLVEKLRELYLLTTNSSNVNSLAHDTLAPIVHRAIQHSEKPGQRALRILSAKMVEYEQDATQTVIDEADLALVERGADGMRIWTTQEQALIRKSRIRKAALEAERRRNRYLKTAGVTLISALLVLITFLWIQSNRLANVNLLTGRALQIGQEDAVAARKQIDQALMLLPDNDMALQVRHDLYLHDEFYLLSLATGNDEAVRGVAFAPGDSLLYISQGKTIYWYDRQGQLKDSLGLKQQAKEMYFLADKPRIVVSSEDHTLRLIDFPERQIRSFVGHRAPVSTIAASPDGQLVLSGDLSGQLILWDDQGKIAVRVPNTGQAALNTLAFSPSDSLFLSAGDDGIIRMYDFAGKLLQTFSHKAKVTSAGFSPNGATIFAGLRNGEIRKWSLEGREMARYIGHQKRINDVQFSPKGPYFLTASDDKSILLWDTSGHILKTYRGHTDFVHRVCFSRDGNFFASASEDGTVKWWKLKSKVIYETDAFAGSINDLVVSRDGKRTLIGLGAPAASDINALTVSSDDFFDQYEPKQAQKAVLVDQDLVPLHTLVGHKGNITAVALHPDDQMVLTGGDEGNVIFWNKNGMMIRQLPAHSSRIFAIACSADGRFVITGAADSTAVLWTIKGDSLVTLPHPDIVSDVIVLPDGQGIWTACYDGQLRRWSPEAELLQQWVTGKESIEACALSPDGKRIATGHGGTSALVRVHNLKGELVMEASTGSADISGGRAVYDLIFSSDGQRLIAGDAAGLLLTFDLNGRRLQTLDEFDGSAISGLGLLPDQKQILVGTKDGRLRKVEVLK